MKKRLSKILWFGDALNENNQAAPPALSPSDEEHLQGLNLGEIYICVADADPALFIRTSADRIVYFKALDIEALSKFFIRKDRPDEAGFLIKFLGGLFSDYIQSMNFSSGALGEGFVIKVDSKTGDSYLEVDHMLARKSATFIELLIQRLRQVGGQIILSPASMSCSKVEEYDTFYRCYFENTDGEKTIVQEFVIGDQARSQTFNIKPGVHENVSNTYYWRLVTSVGDNYIDLSKSDCDTGSAAPQAGDDIVQLGNRTDKTRQNAIVLAAYGNDTPSFRQYAGIDSYSLTGKEVTAFSPNGNKVTGDFILKTGVNILTQFKILEDLIYSEISKVLDEVQAKDNYLYNASFASNTNGWETKNDVRFFTVNGKFLLVNGEFYSRKDAMAAVIRDGDRNVLRILSSGIKQSNADLANKPTYEEGEEPGKFFISFRYKVATAGTLTIGFPGQNLHFTEHLEPGEEYAMKEYSGAWDGTGDFELKFTGDIYIHSLALTENAFEDLYTKLSSEIKQTAENLKLSVTKIEEDVTQLGLDINGVTDELKLYVKKDGLGSEINVALDNISVVSKNIYFTGDISANGNVSIQADGTIKAIGGYFEGEINANSGVFKNVRTPNNSLVIDENGNVSIVGKISTASSGTKIEINPNSNSLKFYNSKGYDVGGISFLDSGGGGTSVTYPRLKLDNIASDGNLTASTTLFAGSLSMISNLSGSRYQVSLGIDGLSFYKDGRLTKSYPSS
ncbi:MAG: hypothetical protein Q3Y00_07245 [Bacteroides sp.]|uniref:hypothetical protein n=1 Tax=Bacteroides sp. TaxID=29523 RepID=UPI0028496B62|nr:hypothetical protein [Bacteroides sp.]MDR3881716.1 hypothetical protein [Bacteroides sp.]